MTTYSGNLTRRPMLRRSSTGTPWCTVGLAVDGPREATTFYDLVAFGAPALDLHVMAKGTGVEVTGRVEATSWTQGGVLRTGRRIVADAVGVRSASTPADAVRLILDSPDPLAIATRKAFTP